MRAISVGGSTQALASKAQPLERDEEEAHYILGVRALSTGPPGRQKAKGSYKTVEKGTLN